MPVSARLTSAAAQLETKRGPSMKSAPWSPDRRATARQTEFDEHSGRVGQEQFEHWSPSSQAAHPVGHKTPWAQAPFSWMQLMSQPQARWQSTALAQLSLPKQATRQYCSPQSTPSGQVLVPVQLTVHTALPQWIGP